MTTQLRDAIARLRRARNSYVDAADIKLVCDALEVSFVKTEAKPRFDKVAYQRAYMRNRRAAAKASR